MLTTKDAAIVYETLLSAPGMNDTVKLSVQLSRKNILLLTKLIEQGIHTKGELAVGNIVSMAGEETVAAIGTFKDELLRKAGLTDLNERLDKLK